MAVGTKRKKAQMLILEEVKKQLLLQADRWGRTGYYTPQKMEEMETEACQRIRSDLLAERSNLEYELLAIKSSKKDVDIKLSKLESYIKRADRLMKRHDKNIEKIIEKMTVDRKKVFGALNTVRMKKEPLISVLISDN